jgi:hypothetical protein
VKITENQIRRIIRSVLNTSMLSEGKQATSWEEYVPYTTENTDIPEEDVQSFVDDYVKVLSRFLEDKDNPDIRDNAVTNQAFLEFMNFLGFTPTMTPSYDDYVKWYKSFNSSESGAKIRDEEDGAGKKYLSPSSLMNVIMFANDIYDASLKKAKEVSRSLTAEDIPEEEVKKGMRNWVKGRWDASKNRRKQRRENIKKKIQQRKMNRTARRTGAKGGEKELSKYET